MFLLQSNPVLKNRLGEGLAPSMVASKLANKLIEDEAFNGVMKSTFNSLANQNALNRLGMNVQQRVAGIGGNAAFIAGLQ